MRAFAVLLVLSLGSSTSCTFAVNHPAATAAIVGGTLGGATCEMGTDFDEHAVCGAVTLGSAALLGGVVLLATLLGGPGDTILRGDEERPVPQDPTLDRPVPQDPTLDQPAPPDAALPAPDAAPSADAP